MTPVTSVLAETNQRVYSFKDEITTVNIPMKSISSYRLLDNYIAYEKMEDNTTHIYVTNLNTGEINKLTSVKSFKGIPVLSQTPQGIMVLWSEQRGSEQGNLFAYDIKSQTTKSLLKGTFSQLTADGSLIAWTNMDTGNIHTYDIVSGVNETIAKGSYPQIKKGIIVYRNDQGQLTVYLSQTKETKLIMSSHIESFAFTGRYILVRERINQTNSFQLYDLQDFRQFGNNLNADEKVHKTYLYADDSFGVWVKETASGNAEVTGADLIFRGVFPIAMKPTPARNILGIQKDVLYFLDAKDNLVKRTIMPPSNRTVRDAEPISVMINGKIADLHHPSLLINENYYVDAAAVLEQLGYKVNWDKGINQLRAEGNGKSVVITADQNSIMAGSDRIPLESSPVVRSEVLYIPIEVINRMGDKKVSVNKDKSTKVNTIYIRPYDTADTLYFENGRIKYKGQLANGIRQGTGASYNEENGGRDYNGEWLADKMHGEGIMYSWSGKSIFFKGKMENGLQLEGIEYYPGTQTPRFEGKYRRGLPWEGRGLNLFPDGTAFAYHLKSGAKNGNAVLYNSDGTINRLLVYKNDIAIQGTFYKNGKVVYKGITDEYGEPISKVNVKK
ncbi:stalk domain-containing protein [Paenibacillus swuensis]|nr:stalk domain-containing protein [Paenibacillus swuensis]